jgi:hypothetical protein
MCSFNKYSVHQCWERHHSLAKMEVLQNGMAYMRCKVSVEYYFLGSDE